MKRRNLIIGGILSFLIFLAIVTNLPEQRDSETTSSNREQTKAERDRAIARVDSAIAAAEAEAESHTLQPYDTEIKTSEVAQVRRRTPTATERYAVWIEDYGRVRAGEMIQAEIKEAWDSGDRKRASSLIEASGRAMQGDHERSKSRSVQRVSWDELQIGSTYRISRQTMLMPEGRNSVDPMTAIGRVRKISPGSTIRVIDIDRNGQPWYEVRVGSNSGWINGMALMGQDIQLVH